MLPARRKRQPLGIRQEPQIRCSSHTKWVRQAFACAIAGRKDHVCGDRIEAAHVRRGTDGGMGVKPSDVWVIPLCNEAHAEQHRIGEQSFEARYGIDMKKVAEQLALRSPHRSKWSKP